MFIKIKTINVGMSSNNWCVLNYINIKNINTGQLRVSLSG